MTARKRVGLTHHRLAVRHSADHSSLDSSSVASSDLSFGMLNWSSRGLSLSDHLFTDLPSTSAGPSSKRRRSPMTYVPALSPVSRALSPVCADLIPSPKRVKDSGYLADCRDNDPVSLGEIDSVLDYADALRDRGIDARVVVEAVDQDETETGVRGPVKEGAVEVTYETLGDLVQRFHDHTQAIPVHRIQVLMVSERGEGYMMLVESAGFALSVRIAKLRGISGGLERHVVLRIEACARSTWCSKMPNTRSGASMTHEEFEELVNRRVAEEMEAREAARTLKPLNENGDEQEGENGGNGNGGK
ncbi:hypothetical protein Tco_0517866 [Tanacetum coccineum]